MTAANLIGRKSLLGDLVTACLARSVSELISFEAGSKSGVDTEDLHHFRVATRRLRSDLQIFHSVLDPSWASNLRNELKWLGTEVGVVRDLDVLQAGLVDRLNMLCEADGAGANRLLTLLSKERSAARIQMLRALEGERYRTLVNTLQGAATHPIFSAETRPVTERQAARLLPSLVKKPWKKLRAAARSITHDSTDEDLHAVRILAKRCRYCADAAAMVCGPDAVHFARAIKEVQAVLGNYHDTVITELWLRRAAQSTPSIGLVAGLLIAGQRNERAALRRQFASVWRQANRPSLRAWLS